LCYADWYLSQGSKLNAGILEAIYDDNPDKALQLVQQQFNIKLPAGRQFRFAYAGHGSIIDPAAAGLTPAFYQELFGDPANDPSRSLGGWGALEAQFCVGLPNQDVSGEARSVILRYYASVVYITDRAFLGYEHFRPDDVAGVMIHEAAHAWQVDVVLKNESPDRAWYIRFQHGMEAHAAQIALDAAHQGRIHPSDSFLKNQQRHVDENTGKLIDVFPYELEGMP